jgi:hypothetical protein
MTTGGDDQAVQGVAITDVGGDERVAVDVGRVVHAALLLLESEKAL